MTDKLIMSTALAERLKTYLAGAIDEVDEADELYQMLQSLPMVNGEPVVQDVRGYLASKLKCWHRLTGEESDQLAELFNTTSPQALTPSEPLEELLGQYWDIAFREGSTNVSSGSEANKVLHKIRQLFKPITPLTAEDITDAEIEEYLSFIEKASYLSHPDVPYLGTANNDTPEKWRRRLAKAAILISEAAQRPRELDKPDCVWTFDEDQGMYGTGCGESWMFSEEPRLAEHSVKFCPFCGGAVKEST